MALASLPFLPFSLIKCTPSRGFLEKVGWFSLQNCINLCSRSWTIPPRAWFLLQCCPHALDITCPWIFGNIPFDILSHSSLMPLLQIRFWIFPGIFWANLLSVEKPWNKESCCWSSSPQCRAQAGLWRNKPEKSQLFQELTQLQTRGWGEIAQLPVLWIPGFFWCGSRKPCQWCFSFLIPFLEVMTWIVRFYRKLGSKSSSRTYFPSECWEM